MSPQEPYQRGKPRGYYYRDKYNDDELSVILGDQTLRSPTQASQGPVLTEEDIALLEEYTDLLNEHGPGVWLWTHEQRQRAASALRSNGTKSRTVKTDEVKTADGVKTVYTVNPATKDPWSAASTPLATEPSSEERYASRDQKYHSAVPEDTHIDPDYIDLSMGNASHGSYYPTTGLSWATNHPEPQDRKTREIHAYKSPRHSVQSERDRPESRRSHHNGYTVEKTGGKTRVYLDGSEKSSRAKSRKKAGKGAGSGRSGSGGACCVL